MKAVVALSLFSLTLALPAVTLSEEISSEMIDSAEMLELEDVSVQETQDLSEESSTAPMRFLEEDSTDGGIFLIPETASPIRVLGKKNRAVYVASPKKYVAPPVQKKTPAVHTKYTAPAPAKKMHAPTKKAPVVMSSKYAPATVSKKYSHVAPSKKSRRLAPVPEQVSEEESTATSISDNEVDDEERELKKRSGYYVAYSPVVATPYCTAGSSCARYLAEEEDVNEETMNDAEEAVYEQSAEERSLGKKNRAVYVAPAPKKYVAPAPQKKVATPVYRAAPLHKKAAAPVVQKKATAPVVQKKAAAFPSKKYHQAVTTSKYTPMTTLSKKRRLAAQEDVTVEEESTATEAEVEEEERDLKKRGTYYYPVAAYPVVATPYCSTGGACY
ncbi:conserved hypothetical protein [Neospora caninum Liverpool]|uniref:Uncharacterized protein n=1 Tax=Neospora caninum (strain Liverpool) TaxID=572307 RepID=F0VKR8_NEOCL|nr:conserved hypothetical protein [Neospora caninum Liverpool]CBZ54669.1 conserved hypothetical protein [Neospora caninum Liverpool]CEL69385.1 TPA: hypothetical protein BN1204_050960 [Neospora caninum Liverpool]|eukprot:XP_003884699.1 conserved hypothetical protein [Neospora caninum Liverpool]